jgi:hypothetical protein
MDAYRQAINNSTFENEQDIGKAISEWAVDYNALLHDYFFRHLLLFC